MNISEIIIFFAQYGYLSGVGTGGVAVGGQGGSGYVTIQYYPNAYYQSE